MASEAKEVIVSHGKVLEPTGEKRMPLKGEFYREHDGVRQAGHDFSNNTWPIYREIKINEMANRLSDAEQRAEEAERKLKGLEVLLENPGDAEIARVLRDRNARVDKLDDELDEIKRQLATERASHANMAAEFELIAAGKHPRYWTLEPNDVLYRPTNETRRAVKGEWYLYDGADFQKCDRPQTVFQYPIYRRIDAPADASKEQAIDPKMIPVFAAKTDGTPLTTDEAVALAEHCAKHAPIRTPFTKLLKAARLNAQFGMREFAEHVGICPSRFAAIQNGREQPTDAELSAIIMGLRSAPDAPADATHNCEWKRVDTTTEVGEYTVTESGAVIKKATRDFAKVILKKLENDPELLADVCEAIGNETAPADATSGETEKRIPYEGTPLTAQELFGKAMELRAIFANVVSRTGTKGLPNDLYVKMREALGFHWEGVEEHFRRQLLAETAAPAPPAEEEELDVWKYRVFSMDMRENPVGRRIAKFETPGDADAFHEWLQELRDELINRREQVSSQADQQDGKELA